MKRILSIVLAVLVVVALAACGGKSSGGIEGKYVVKTIGGQPVEEAIKSMLDEYGDGMPVEDWCKENGIKAAEEFIVLQFKSDGTMQADYAGMGSFPGTWKLDGSKLTILYDDQQDDPVEFTVNGNELSFKEDAQDYVFIRK